LYLARIKAESKSLLILVRFSDTTNPEPEKFLSTGADEAVTERS